MSRIGGGGYAESRGGGVGDGTGGGRSANGRDGKNGDGKSRGGSNDRSNPAINPGNKNLGLSGPNYSGPQGPGTGVNASNPNNNPGEGRSPKDGGLGGLGWDKSFGPAPMSLNDGTWGSGYGSQITNTASGVPVDIDKLMHDWLDKFGMAYGDMEEDGPLTKAANALASFFGATEMNPMTDLDYGLPGTSEPGTGAHWGLDTVKAFLSIGGFANPALKAASTLYSAADMLGVMPENKPWGIDMGSSFFGGATQSPPTGFGSAALGNQSATTSSTSGKASTPQTDIGRGGGNGYGSIVSTNTAQPAPTAPAPEAKAAPAVSSGPLPPGVSVIQPPVPVRNRDTGAWSSPFINGSGFSSGYGSIVRI